MSVIGPRPGLWNQDILTAERDKYNANDVKPGLTGWAQINGRDELEIPVKAKLDGEYVKKMGPLMDIKCFLPSNMIAIEHTNSVKELVELYSAADIFVNPTLEDNYPTTNLMVIFYRLHLKLDDPEVYLNAVGEDLGETCGNIIAQSYKLMAEIKPDAVLVLGDTNSCLSVIGAKRLHIPIFHMEAGNRCKDECLPEETNRRMVWRKEI